MVEGVSSSLLLPLDIVNLDVPATGGRRLSPSNRRSDSAAVSDESSVTRNGRQLSPAVSQCSYLDIVESPKRVVVTGASLQGSYSPFEGKFTVVAYNGLGERVQATAVSMFLVDAAGIFIYETESPTPYINSMTQSYQTFIARSGGGLAFPLGNVTASMFGIALPAPIASNDTDMNGEIRFTQSRIAAAHNTFAR
jgi:hypothetical protein